MISPILNWLFFILLEVARNLIQIKVYDSPPTYRQSFLIRGFFGIVIGVLFDPEAMWQVKWWKAIAVIVFEFSSFYLVFDPLLNKFLGNKWNYRGKESGWLDPNLNNWEYIALKTLCLVLLILSLNVLI